MARTAMGGLRLVSRGTPPKSGLARSTKSEWPRPSSPPSIASFLARWFGDAFFAPRRAVLYDRAMEITNRTAVRMIRFVLSSFFRRIEVVGTHNVPKEGGGILIAWHPNGLVDPALILSSFPRSVVFGARHGLFKWPLLGSVMRAIGTVPIYRATDVPDGDENARRTANRRSLDALAQAICEGRFAALFPEGLSHDEPSPQELRTGAARLYYRARQMSALDATPPAIIPVGLHYDDKTTFRSDALVEFHPLLNLNPELDSPIPDDDEALLRTRSADLTAVLEPVLREVTHATESWELNRLMHRARTLTRAEHAKRAGASLKPPDMAERSLGMARIWKAYEARSISDPLATEGVLERLRAYDAALRDMKLEDDDLDKPPAIESKWLPLLLLVQAAVVFLVFPPVLLLGLLINAGPYFLTDVAAKIAAKQHKDTATIKLLSAMVLFPATWLLTAVLVSFGQLELHESFAGIPRAPWAAGVTTFSIGAFGGALALIYVELVQGTWSSLQIRAKRTWARHLVAQLATERADLFDTLVEMGQGLELPGHLHEDGTVSAAPSLSLGPEDVP